MGRPLRTLRARSISPLTTLEELENQGDYLRPSVLPETKSPSAEWTTFMGLDPKNNSCLLFRWRRYGVNMLLTKGLDTIGIGAGRGIQRDRDFLD